MFENNFAYNKQSYLIYSFIMRLLSVADSTAEYISGKEVLSSVNGLYSGGLQCVTVLIGAFNYYDQIPVLGVVNQPFYTNVGEGLV